MVGVKASMSAEYSEATTKRLIEDAIFLYAQAIKANDEFDKIRYSRTAITLIPYYLESFSNYLYHEFTDVEIENNDNRTDLPKPIRMLKFVYYECLNEELKDKDINSIRDIFTVRNKITAHPLGRSNLVSTDNGWKRKDKSITYHTLLELPFVYSHFRSEHVYLIFNEVHDFLIKYITSIKKHLNDEQYKYIWPQELISWKQKLSSPPPTDYPPLPTLPPSSST